MKTHINALKFSGLTHKRIAAQADISLVYTYLLLKEQKPAGGMAQAKIQRLCLKRADQMRAKADRAEVLEESNVYESIAEYLDFLGKNP
jgi:hypothetical protein